MASKKDKTKKAKAVAEKAVAEAKARKEQKTLMDINLKKSWFKQAFLMTFQDELTAPLRKKEIFKPSKYIKLLESETGNTSSIVNLVTMSSEVLKFLVGTPFEYSQLVPSIEIYKVYVLGKEDIRETLMPFNSHTDFQSTWGINLGSEVMRGTDAGIEKIDVTMEGRTRNPFSANIMDVSISYVFNDVKTLFKPFPSGLLGQDTISFADLIRFPPGLKKQNELARGASFRIRLALGWNMNEGNPAFEGNRDFVEAAKKAKVNIICDLYDHTLDFREDGSVKLTAKYKGALESVFSSGVSDILYNISIDGNKQIQQEKDDIARLEQEWKTAKSAGLNKNLRIRRDELNASRQALDELNQSRLKLQSWLGANPNPEPGDNTYKQLAEAEAGAYKKYQATTAAGGVDAAEIKQLPKLKKLRDKANNVFKEQAIASTSARKEINSSLAEITGDQREFNKIIAEKKVGLRNLKFNLRAAQIFDFMFDLMDEQKMAWVPIGDKCSFKSYAQYLNEASGLSKEEHITNVNKVKSALCTPIIAKPKEAADIANAGKDKVKALVAPTETKTVTGPGGKVIETSIIKKLPINRHRAEKWGAADYKEGDKLFYFMLGDLITSIMNKNGFGERLEQAAPNFRLLFGPIDYEPVSSEDVRTTNLYYVPISLELFRDFMTQKIAGTGREVYPLMSFIQDLLKFFMDKIVASVGKAASKSLAKPDGRWYIPKLDITPVDLKKHNLSSNNYLIKLRGTETLQNDGNTSAANTVSTFLLNAQSADPFMNRIEKTRRANVLQDAKEGIFHFVVGGPQRGILKNIKFTEHKSGLFSVALYRQAQDGGNDAKEGIIKPAKFTVEISLIGNPYFYIGQHVYVDTKLIDGGNFIDNNLLLGGYYIIISVKNSFSSSEWTTNISAVLTISDKAIRDGKSREKFNTYTKDPPEKKPPTPTEIAGNVPPVKPD